MYSQETDLHAILILDENSQHDVMTSVSELVRHDIKIIPSLENLTDDLVRNYNTVILLEKYLLQDNSISNLRLYKEVFKLDYIYIGTDDVLLTLMRTVAKCFKMSIEQLTYEKLLAVILNDDALLEKYTLDYLPLENHCLSLKEDLLKQGLFDGIVKSTYETLVSLLSILEYKDDLIKTLDEKCITQEREITTNEEQADALYKEMFRVMSAEYQRDLNIKQYEVILTEDIYKKISLINYRNRPLIIYFKQYTKLNDFDYLITTLYNAIRIQKGLRCKVLKLYDSKDSIEIALQPNYMKLIRNNFTTAEVEVNDFIVKFGDYSKVLDILLNNKMGADILLVFDCKGHNDRVLSGADLYLDICHSKDEIKPLGLDYNLTIVNDNPDSLLNWHLDKEKLEHIGGTTATQLLMAQSVIKTVLSNIDTSLEEE